MGNMEVRWIILFLIIGGSVLVLLRFLGWTKRKRRLPTVGELCPGWDGIGESEGLPVIKWLGHSSYRLEWQGETILLDPVLSNRVSVSSRLCALPDASVLDGVDHVLVSHAHMDHLDNATLSRIDSCRLYLPRNSERFLTRRVMDRHAVRRFELGQTLELGSLQATPVHARHGGWRYPWQKGYFACGFILTDGRTTLYYAGDTAWDSHFEEIGECYRPDIAILPIGGYSPRWFLKSRHLCPEEAVQAAGKLGSKWVIPSHFGTYRVSMEPNDEPLKRFKSALLNP